MDEQTRVFLAIALTLFVFLGWSYLSAPPEKSQKTPPVQQEENDGIRSIQDAGENPAVQKTDTVQASRESADRPARKEPKTIIVNTPLYTARLTETGAMLESVQLKHYRETTTEDASAKEMIPKSLPFGTIHTRFKGGTFPEMGFGVYTADIKGEKPVLTVNDDKKNLTFTLSDNLGRKVQKRYIFSAQTYLIHLEIDIINASGTPINDKLAVSLFAPVPEKASTYTFQGPSTLISNQVEHIKIKPKDVTRALQENKETLESLTGKPAWIANETRYFISAILPEKKDETQVEISLAKKELQTYQPIEPEGLVPLKISYIYPASSIPEGAKLSSGYDLYLGPKSYKILNRMDNQLAEAINFGWFDILAKPFLWLMNFIHDFIPNYGIAIIILTILIKIVLWPLGNMGYKSMNEMKKIQPLMAELREKYKDDKQRMNQELMNLYRTYKINPLGGCLPLLLQIPIFIAFYRMLYEAIELRHATFLLWIDDLSAPDRLFRFDFSVPFMQPPYGIPVLTLVMGASMILQQKMSPPPGDPTQAKMMMFMPVVFTVIFINFPSGLVLYWLVNNILSIFQQYYIAKKYA